MEQPALLGKPADLGEIFLVMHTRLGEIFFFFRSNIMALLAVTLPFAIATSLIVHGVGEPVVADGKSFAVNSTSALLLSLLYPLALGAKVIAIHHLARGEGITFAALLVDTLRAWPVLAGISLLMGLAVGSGLFLFIVPGIWCYARLGYAPILAVTEKLGVIAALTTSWQRTQAQQLELFTLAMLIGGVLVMIMLLVLNLISHTWANTPLAADIAARSLDELLFCLLTIAFYRYGSLAVRTP